MINLPLKKKKKAQEKANKNGLRALIYKFPTYNVTHLPGVMHLVLITFIPVICKQTRGFVH